jgi:hypothetical protein
MWDHHCCETREIIRKVGIDNPPIWTRTLVNPPDQQPEMIGKSLRVPRLESYRNATDWAIVHFLPS